MARFVVITGTDTGVGKTVVAAGLSRALSRSGRRVFAVKPIESGCSGAPSRNEDGVLLAEATGQTDPAHALVRLRAPLAPPVAADFEGVELDLGVIAEQIVDLGRSSDFVIIEGAGGLLSPLTWDGTIVNLASWLDAAVVVVASDRLGSVNHALLTLDCLRNSASASITTEGVIFNAPADVDESTGSNAATLMRCEESRGNAVRVAQLARVSEIDEAADRLEGVVEWLV